MKPHQNGIKCEPSSDFEHHFNFEGRKFRLFKRKQDRMAPYYCVLRINGKRKMFNSQTNQKEVAQNRVINQGIKPMKSDRWNDVAGIRPEKTATIGEVLVLYRKYGPINSKDSTVRATVNIFVKWISDHFGVEKSEVPALRLSVLTDGLIEGFKDECVLRYTKGLPDGDERVTARHRGMHYANRILSSRNCVFSRAMQARYRSESIVLPECFQAFMSVPKFRGVRIHKEIANDKLINATFQAAQDLDNGPVKVEDYRHGEYRKVDVEGKRLYLVFWMIMATGLRKSEIIQARWEYFQEVDGRMKYLSPTIGKDGNRVAVPVLSDAWTMLKKYRQPEGDFLGTNHSRVFKWFSDWMKELGWTNIKKAHDLRAWIGSKVIEQHGLTAGSAFLRHKDERTTKNFYAHHYGLKELDVKLPMANRNK